jgi:hypothetical protein
MPVDIPALFSQIVGETGLPFTQFDLARLEEGLRLFYGQPGSRDGLGAAEPAPYRRGDWTWELMDGDRVQILRWNGAIEHWPKRIVDLGEIYRQSGLEGAQRLLRTTISAMSREV